MGIITSVSGKISKSKELFSKASLKKKLLFLIILLAAGWFSGHKIISTGAQQIQYQTAQAEKGTLITSISASGIVLPGSSASITTQATGIVNQVYIKDGDIVTQGQKIADITLDIGSQQKQAAAWSAYLSAKNSLDSAQAKINSLQAAAFKANQTFMNDAVARDLATDDPTYIQENALWLQAEADYKNQGNTITQAQAALNSSWLSYIQLSSTITSPMAGRVSGLTLTPGLSITGSQGESESSMSSSSVGTIVTENSSLQGVVNLTEIDVTEVSPGQKVTLTLDAFPGKTFAGKVSTINTSGSVSSGVTTYPTTITFDTALNNIYPNMAVNATIITNIKDSAVLVPSAAVQTSNGQSIVRVLKDGQLNLIPVEVGDSNDTQTEIASGINEGDAVVTGSTNSGTTRPGTSGATSPFGSFGGSRGSGGGAVIRGGGGIMQH
ncbi:efflux RND transporter periplasmic adaptor subunit [Candidatus Daviesbacteria bacterium]|nr:efflux RND transporter periplasmic adaptor subunit [Candidatus Daviesbacteria bacterium]